MSTLAEFNILPVEEKVRRMMAVIAAIETGGGVVGKADYKSPSHSGHNASGAYQMMPDTWRGYAKDAGLTSPPGEAYLADKTTQDAVVFFKFNQWFKQYGDRAAYFIPLNWFYPIAAQHYLQGDDAYLDRKAPGDNGGLTFRDYLNKALGLLTGTSDFSEDEGIVPDYTFKNPLPICVSEPRVTGDDVRQIEDFLGVTWNNGVYGTLMQYAVMQFQQDVGLPINGCWGQREVELFNSNNAATATREGTVPVADAAYSALRDKVIANKNIKFTDVSKENDVKNGGDGVNGPHTLLSKKLLLIMLDLAQNHTFLVSSVISSHPQTVNGVHGARISPHKKGAGLDISVVDGVPINSGASGGREKLDEIHKQLSNMPPLYRPRQMSTFGSGISSSSNGVQVFADGHHNNHIHITAS